MGTNEPNHEAWRPPTVRNFWGKRMHVTHIEKHDWLETCHMEMEMPSGFTKKSNRQLRQADYKRLQPHIHRMVKLSYIWPFWDYWSYIVHRAKLSLKVIGRGGGSGKCVGGTTGPIIGPLGLLCVLTYIQKKKKKGKPLLAHYWPEHRENSRYSLWPIHPCLQHLLFSTSSICARCQSWDKRGVIS